MRYLFFGVVWGFVFVVLWENAIMLPHLGTLAKAIGIIVIAAGSLFAAARGRISFHPFHLAGVLFVLWAWVGMLWSIDQQATVTRLVTYMGLWFITTMVYQFKGQKNL